MKRKSRNYINNKDLMEHFVKFKQDIKHALENNLEKPQIPHYIVEAIIQIATNLNNKGNFYMYSYKEDMVADGIETCIKYVDRFNPEKYDNPFAYITTICYNASLRRINLEKKQTLIKSQIVKNSGIIDSLQMNLMDNEECKEANTYLKFLYDLPDATDKKDKTKVRNKPGRKSKKDLEYKPVTTIDSEPQSENDSAEDTVDEYFEEIREFFIDEDNE